MWVFIGISIFLVVGGLVVLLIYCLHKRNKAQLQQPNNIKAMTDQQQIAPTSQRNMLVSRVAAIPYQPTVYDQQQPQSMRQTHQQPVEAPFVVSQQVMTRSVQAPYLAQPPQQYMQAPAYNNALYYNPSTTQMP